LVAEGGSDNTLRDDGVEVLKAVDFGAKAEDDMVAASSRTLLRAIFMVKIVFDDKGVDETLSLAECVDLFLVG